MPKRRVVRHEVVQPLDQSYRLIPLTQGQNAIVDIEDYDWLSEWNWFAKFDKQLQAFYAARNGPRGGVSRYIPMHRVILSCTNGEECDHKNHNTLDNRRKNLRKCSHSENSKNQKTRKNNAYGFKGISFRKDSGRWRSWICFNGKKINLGHFDNAVKAARAYDKAAKVYFREFAHLNFPSLKN